MPQKSQVLRVFEVKARPGCVDELKTKLADTSVSVVKGKPGNEGYYFGQLENADGRDLVFISIWASLDAVKRHFGEAWSVSFLPEGYDALIEACSVKHYSVSAEVAPD